MKRKLIAELHVRGEIDTVQVLMAPSDEKAWILFFEEVRGRSYFLVADDEICHFDTLDDAIQALHELGFKHAEIRF